MKKLQVALDLQSTQAAISMLEKVGKYVDIIELGTPLMISEGTQVIKTIKELYPNKILFSDIKIMDGGSIMADIVFKAGADMVSVLAQANNETIKDVIETAKKYNKKVLVDMCAVKDITSRAKEIEQWNPDYICVHVGYDVQNTGTDPVEEVKKLTGIKCEKAAAGGIKLATFEEACKSDIDDIIVGGGLFNEKNPEETAKKMYQILNKYR